MDATGVYDWASNSLREHLIRLVPHKLNAVEANKTLFHELKHAEQAERLGWDHFDVSYTLYTEVVKRRWHECGRDVNQWESIFYGLNPYEAEALDAEKLADSFKLTGPHGSWTRPRSTGNQQWIVVTST